MRKFCIIAALIFAVSGCSGEKPKIEMESGYASLTNSNATPETASLYNYIQSIGKDKILSGQQESVLKENPVTHQINPEYEMEYIFNITGKYPAIRGFDFINNDFSGVVSRASDWHKKGGIVSIIWQWGTPPRGKGYESAHDNPDTIFQNPRWWSDLYDEKTDLNKGFTELMNKAADALLELQAEDVPVLWTPFHEFDGGWYWWSKGGNAEFVKLWRYMYRYFTDVRKINNLIWVLGYSRNVKDGWNPGRNYYDISGATDFPENQKSTPSNLYEKVAAAVNNSAMSSNYANTETPIALVQCEKIPSVENGSKTNWVYFINRHTSSLTENNTPEDLREIYTSNRVITLDELPGGF